MFVLVHGGGFTGSCWDPLTPLLNAPALAVDLPGRGARTTDVAEVTIGDCVDAVAADIVDRDLWDVVLVGHSLAGVTLPGVIRAIPERLAHVVFVSCTVPAHGGVVSELLDQLDETVRDTIDRLGEHIVTDSGALHPELAAAMYGNDMTADQVAWTTSQLVPESNLLISDAVDLTGLGAPIPKTFVRLLQDRSVALDTQNRMIGHLGNPSVVDLDAGHMVMISQPQLLADVLNGLP